MDTAVPMGRTYEQAMESAAQALAARNVHEALGHWAEARRSKGAHVEAWLFAAKHLSTSEAVSLLQEASSQFPNSSIVHQDLARAADRKRDWKIAEKAWRDFNQLEPRWWGFVGLCGALLHLDRPLEAETVICEAFERFPDDVHVAAQHAKLSEAKANWTEAIARWQGVVDRFPNAWLGFRGLAGALRASGRQEEADDYIGKNCTRFPEDIDALHDRARLQERQRDWVSASSTWRALLTLQNHWEWAWTGLVRALRELGQISEAQSALSEAMTRLPTNVAIATEAARLSDALDLNAEAVQHWRHVGRLQPSSTEGTIGEATALRRMGRFDLADEIIALALSKFPDDERLHDAYGLNALACENWVVAMERFQANAKQFPNNDGFRQRLHELQLRIADSGTSIPPPAVSFQENTATSDLTLMMEFESLGGGGHGCEFGIFQRHFGAEPLGLLRWADIYQDQLCTALDTEFAGVGEPEYTNIFIPATSGRPEYWTTDKRYHMAMRCFVHADEVPLETMKRQVSRRFVYLRNKLLDDLKAGSKIFVYKNMKRNLTPDELDRLYNSVRRYGDNTMLYIRYADEMHPNGSIIVNRPGLMVGFIDHFSHSPDTDEYLGAATDSLLRVCRQAHHLWKRNYSHVTPAELPQKQSVRSSHVFIQNNIDAERTTGLSTKELLSKFDTLGENCEFGFIQREFGAEPISLMRFAGMRWEEMAFALNENFEGIDAENNVRLELGADKKQWDVRDRKFNIHYHTFLPVDGTDPERLLSAQIRRLRWLADKLLSDIRDKEKIFLAWRADAKNSREIAPLLTAMRRHGDATLILVDSDTGNPGVTEMLPNFLIGSVNSTRISTNGRDFRGWLSMVANAWILVSNR